MIRVRLFLIVLVFYLLFCPFVWSQSFEAQKDEMCRNLEGFKLQDISGKEVSLKEIIRNGPVLLVFWASWCPACRQGIARLMSPDLKIDTSRVVLVNIREKKEKVEAFLSKFNRKPFTVLLDSQGALTSDCRVTGIPAYIVIDRDGKVEFTGHYLPEKYKEAFKTED